MEELLTQLDQLAVGTDPHIQQKINHIKSELTELFSNQENKALSPKALREQQVQSKEVQQVIQIVNELLKDTLQWNYCTLKQKTIVTERKTKYGWSTFNFTRLDAMERAFRQSGRKVSYDKPWRDESYDAFFKFNITK